MAQTLDGQLFSISLAATINNPLTKQSVAAAMNIANSFGWTSGNNAQQADRIWALTNTIAASGNASHDLNGALTDAVGTTLSLARVKLLYVAAAAANTNNVVVGGAGTNTFINWVGAAAHTVIVRPGGALLLIAPDLTGYGVTAATGDILQVANSGAGTSVTYDIVVIGSSV